MQVMDCGIKYSSTCYCKLNLVFFNITIKKLLISRENRNREKVLKQGEDSGNFDSIISQIYFDCSQLTRIKQQSK